MLVKVHRTLLYPTSLVSEGVSLLGQCIINVHVHSLLMYMCNVHACTCTCIHIYTGKVCTCTLYACICLYMYMYMYRNTYILLDATSFILLFNFILSPFLSPPSPVSLSPPFLFPHPSPSSFSLSLSPLILALSLPSLSPFSPTPR